MYFQCVPWRDRSCCTFNTTHLTHHGSPYNFNFNHCGHVKNMSEECRRHFIQDSCFYECSPNVGPWVVKVEMKIRNERFVHVPLCSSDCEAWFEACIDDYTCTDNWVQNFKWAGGTNQCHPGSECRTFRETFETAENFCHKEVSPHVLATRVLTRKCLASDASLLLRVKNRRLIGGADWLAVRAKPSLSTVRPHVWDESWEVTPDELACMRIWFDGSKGNPNDNVAKLRVAELVRMANSGGPVSLHHSLVLMLLLVAVVRLFSA
uniref:Folate receptor-like domain-containing protein n=1 Tax=Timema tahoe TaxID=61484 RepID=A0A7R9ISV4_9NEOP|nr:unnamed protein product [Timema tahoe]